MVGDSCRCSDWLCLINMKIKPPESSLPVPKTSSIRGSSSSWRSHLSRMSPLIKAWPRWCRQPRPELGVRTAALVSRLPGVGADIVLYKYTSLQGSSTGSSVNSTQHLCWVVLSPRRVLKGIVCSLGFSEAGWFFWTLLGQQTIYAVTLNPPQPSLISKHDIPTWPTGHVTACSWRVKKKNMVPFIMENALFSILLIFLGRNILYNVIIFAQFLYKYIYMIFGLFVITMNPSSLC